MNTVLLTFGVSLAVQAVFFVFAAGLKTDKVTDLSYGLTFVLLAGFLFSSSGGAESAAAVVLAAMVVVWGVRLAGYLLYRILRMGRDARFDGIRERPWSFAKFWILQGVAVWLIMLPVTLWFDAPAPWGWTKTAGVLLWLAGLVIETVADLQKFTHKTGPAGRRWVESGLWRYSRHPNYFGELLCWWGVFVFVAGDLGWLAVPGLAGPMAITLVLLFLTGIPTLERSAERKYGGQPDYEAYKRRTSLLVPWPPRPS